MVSDYSPRLKRKMKKKSGPAAGKQKIACGPWFWKLSGMLVIAATVMGIIGSLWFSWKIRTGLDELAREQGKKHELQQISMLLREDEKVVFSKERIEAVSAAELALHPPKEKYLGGGITVRTPRP